MRRRSAGSSRRCAVARSLSNRVIRPRDGGSADADQLEKSGFSRARQARKEGEGARLQRKADIAQHFGTAVIAHAHIFEPDHDLP